MEGHRRHGDSLPLLAEHRLLRRRRLLADYIQRLSQSRAHPRRLAQILAEGSQQRVSLHLRPRRRRRRTDPRYARNGSPHGKGHPRLSEGQAGVCNRLLSRPRKGSQGFAQAAQMGGRALSRVPPRHPDLAGQKQALQQKERAALSRYGDYLRHRRLKRHRVLSPSVHQRRLEDNTPQPVPRYNPRLFDKRGLRGFQGAVRQAHLRGQS